MTVRGGKNRVLIYTGAGLLIVALVLFYHNAATRLDDARTKYERCHLSEESLAAQLQVILEYKSRLEKSLQQEKSDHAQSREESKNKAEEERMTRERDNLESINKFTALQSQYKLLQSQHEDVTQELDKAKQELLAFEEKRVSFEEQITSLTRQVQSLQDGRNTDNTILQSKLSQLETAYEKLKKESNADQLIKEKSDLQRELSECLHNQPSITARKTDTAQEEMSDTLIAPLLLKPKAKSSTTNREELLPAAAGAVANKYNYSSTPHINPDAVQGLESTSPGTLTSKKNGADQQQAPPVVENERPRPQIHPAPPPVNEAVNNVFPYDVNEMEDNRKQDEDEDMDQLDEFDEKGPDPANAPPVRIANPGPHDSIMVNPK